MSQLCSRSQDRFPSPEVSKLAIKLKEEGLIDFKDLPITRVELENAIMGLKSGDMNE